MIDNSICYLLHDMIGKDFSVRSEPNSETQETARLDWSRFTETLWAQYRIGTYNAVQDILNEQGHVVLDQNPALVPAYYWKNYENCPTHTPDPTWNDRGNLNTTEAPNEIWVGRVVFSVDGRNCYVIEGTDFRQMYDLFLRISPLGSRSVISNRSGNFVNSIRSGVIKLGTVFLAPDDLSTDVDDDTMLGLEVPYPADTYFMNANAVGEGFTILPPCWCEDHPESMFLEFNFDPFDENLTVVFEAKLRLPVSYGAALIESVAAALYPMHHIEANAPWSNNQFIELRTMPHTPMSCDICQEREEFSDIQAANKIRELIRST